MKKIVFLVGIILLSVYFAVVFHLNVKFDHTCRNPLYHVAYTTDIQEAKEILGQVTGYFKEKNLLQNPVDYTNKQIFLRFPKNWKKPSQSITRWYLDLTFLHQRLKTPETIDKTREQKLFTDIQKTILDQQGRVKIPQGIAKFPYNTPLTLLLIISIGLISIGGIGILVKKKIVDEKA